jgi:putative ABC transport system permease protein
VVGFTKERRYVMAPAFYVAMPTWEEIYVAGALGVEGAVPSGSSGEPTSPSILEGAASVVSVDLAPTSTPASLAEHLGEGFEVATPEEAALAGNGMPVMVLAVDGIQVFSLVLGTLIVGLFFYVTTIHKTGQIAAVKALGASNAYLYRQLLWQIALLVTAAVVVGTALALGAGASMPSTMAFDPRPDRWILTVVSVYVMAIIGSLFSLRSILRIDPATALDRGEH